MRTIATLLAASLCLGVIALFAGCNAKPGDEGGKTAAEIRASGPEAGKAGILSKGGPRAETAK